MAGNGNSRAGLAVLPLITLLCCSVVMNNLVRTAEGVWLTIPRSGTKCVSEEIHSNVVVLANFYAFSEEHPETIPAISVKVTSPFGNNLHQSENSTHGEFAFTTTETGNYMACFWQYAQQQQQTTVTLGLDWKIGIAAKDWDSVARKEKIEGVELDLRRLEESVQAIRNKIIYLKEKYYSFSIPEFGTSAAQTDSFAFLLLVAFRLFFLINYPAFVTSEHKRMMVF